MTRLDIKQKYFRWLYHQVFEIRDPDSPLSYENLCLAMHSVPFNDSVPNDSNRADEGGELRNEFISTLNGITIGDYAELREIGKATILEVLIALARRADFQSEHGVGEWFRQFLENLGLLKYRDTSWIPRDEGRVTRILNIFNERQYSESGEGGIFPLKHSIAHQDQRQIELWAQLHAYLRENEPF